MNCPFFSIIIPVFNRADIIKPTLNTIFEQSYLGYELILVDDGSSDDTLKVLRAYTKPNIQVFSIVNSERGAARNFGAGKAKGRYLIFFDSDDLLFSDTLQRVYDFLTLNKFPQVAYTGFQICNTAGKVLKNVLVEEKDWYREIIKDNFMGCNSVVIRKDIFDHYKFNEDRRLATMEDKELWLRIGSRCRFRFIPIVGHRMIEHEGRSLNTISADKREEAVISFVSSLSKDEYFRQYFRSKACFIFSFEYSLLSTFFSITGNKKKGFRYLKKALFTFPAIFYRKRFLAAIKNLILAR